jgi:hypothetical protein
VRRAPGAGAAPAPARPGGRLQTPQGRRVTESLSKAAAAAITEGAEIQRGVSWAGISAPPPPSRMMMKQTRRIPVAEPPGAERPVPETASPTAAAVLALQRTAGNQAVARMLRVARQGDGGAGGASPAGPVGTGAEGTSGVDPQAPEDQAVVRWYMDHAPTPFSRKLIHHYAYGGGALYEWGLDDMIAVGDLHIDVFDEERFQAIDAVVRQLTAPLKPTASGEAVASTPASAQVADRGLFAAIHNSVGGFSVHVSGTVTASPRPDRQLPDVAFEGTMHWTDTWDFDTRWFNRIKGWVGAADAKEDSRTLSGEIKTTIAALTLPGQGFPMRTAGHAVRQARFRPLEWEGAGRG